MTPDDIAKLAQRIAEEEIGGPPPRCTGHYADRYNAAYNAVVKALAAFSAHGLGAEEGRAWPDIGADPLKLPRPDDRYEASRLALRQAYTKQQDHVPDQTALVWRWHLGTVLEMALRLQVLLKRDEVSSPRLDAATVERVTKEQAREKAEVHFNVDGFGSIGIEGYVRALRDFGLIATEGWRNG